MLSYSNFRKSKIEKKILKGALPIEEQRLELYPTFQKLCKQEDGEVKYLKC